MRSLCIWRQILIQIWLGGFEIWLDRTCHRHPHNLLTDPGHLATAQWVGTQVGCPYRYHFGLVTNAWS